MHPLAQEVLSDLLDRDESKPRSRQDVLGPSQIGGCRRQATYILTGAEKHRPGSSFAAVVGTAIHRAIEEARAERARREGLLQEVEVNIELVPGQKITGHIDEVDPEQGIVRDWKTTSAGRIALFRESGPPKEHITQVSLYAAAAIEGGLLPHQNPDNQPLCQLVYLDRHGQAEPYVHEWLYDPADLEPAVDWLHDVADALSTGDPAPQDKPVTWCRDWCEYYRICREPELSVETTRPLDAETADDARLYLRISRKMKSLGEARDELKTNLVGVQGTTDDGITVTWTSYERADYTVKGGKVERLDVRKR